jgi:hypothetical protein
MTIASRTLVGLVALAGCRLADTTTPVPQPDSLIFGRIAAVRPLAAEPGVTEVDVQAGLPAKLQDMMRRENRPIPALEKDLLVRARVGADTLCVADLRASDLDAFRVGQEVTIVPRPGTCAMVGTKLLLAEAAELYRFADYQVRALPRSLPALPSEISLPSDPGRINSAGTERAPLPLAGGRVVYFAAGLLPALAPQGQQRGAVRAGMRGAEGAPSAWAAAGGYRPYRVEWQGDRWGTPEYVELDGLPADASARLTWVDATETACLVEVERQDAGRTLLSSARARAGERWGSLAAVSVEGGGSIGDAQRFGTHSGALVWTLYDAGASDLWLSLQGQRPGPVDPRINTLGAEWAPRVGPNNSLYFCRGERQLVFTGGAVEEVRLPGAQLRPLLEAAPTADGAFLLVRVPRFVPGEPDWDLAVVARSSAGRWGAATALDDWRPVS